MTKIRNRYNHAKHLTKDINGKVTTSQIDIKNESQEVSPFPVGEILNTGPEGRLGSTDAILIADRVCFLSVWCTDRKR